MKYTATFVLERTSDLVSRFRDKPRGISAAFTRSAVRNNPRKTRISTEMLVRRLAQPVMRRRLDVAFRA